MPSAADSPASIVPWLTAAKALELQAIAAKTSSVILMVIMCSLDSRFRIFVRADLAEYPPDRQERQPGEDRPWEGRLTS
ncbi:MAG: hypothetical protein HZB91_11330 [Elusimicrobia bacterium]|nr:hypothetical protein [Elusimicrobiota bacterium]